MAKNKKKHLRKEERFCIEKMVGQGKSFAEIGRTLGRGLSTVSEEVMGNGGRENYDAKRADHRAYLRQYWKKRECNKVALNGHVSRFVERKLSLGWSPETIRDRLRIQSGIGYAGAKSIRKYVKKRHGLERLLFWGRNNRKSGKKRAKESFLYDPDRKFIELRPRFALFEYGHWEGDFIVSTHNSWVLLVLVEKFSKTVLLSILQNRNNDLVNHAVTSLLAGRTVKTLTFDNDIAFGKWKELETMLGTHIYFCHAYHSREKGLVENTNRWLRVFVPKRSNIALYSKEYIQWIEKWFSHTPRQCLSGETPYEVMMRNEVGVNVVSLEINLPNLRIWG